MPFTGAFFYNFMEQSGELNDWVDFSVLELHCDIFHHCYLLILDCYGGKCI